MKSLRWLALAATLTPAVTLATPVGALDVYSELVRFHAKPGRDNLSPFGSGVPGTAGAFKALLEKPDSLYSKLQADPPFAREPWWQAFAREMAPGEADPSRATLTALQHQLGLTRARPGHDVTIDDAAVARYKGREVAANALKAGIDADIFWKARDLNGSQITIAAAEAVALQMLRDRMYATPKAQWNAGGIRRDVHDRYMTARSPDELSESDQAYLASIATYALQVSGPTRGWAHGEHQLPAAFRMARTAAAYKDELGYFATEGYCKNDAPRPGLPTDATGLQQHAPLCFIAATDHAVLEWYIGEADLEASGIRIHENSHDTWSRLAMWVGGVLTLLDLGAFVEGVEEALADETIDGLAEEDGLSGSSAIRDRSRRCWRASE